MINNKLLNGVRLPYNTVKGSFDFRQYKAAQFSHEIINSISGQFDNKGVSLSKLGRIFKHVLPQNLSVCVKKDKGKDSGAQLNRIIDENNFFVQHTIDLNPDKKGRITILDIPTLAHEIRHLADSLFHPKFLAREQFLYKVGLDNDKFFNFYDGNVYVKEYFYGKKDKKYILKKVRYQTLKVLRGLNTENKVNILQWMRYNLISERNAYKQGQKIAKKFNNKNIPVYEDELYDQRAEYMFNEKIKLFEDMAFELIKRERGIHRAKIKNLKKN